MYHLYTCRAITPYQKLHKWYLWKCLRGCSLSKWETCKSRLECRCTSINITICICIHNTYFSKDVETKSGGKYLAFIFLRVHFNGALFCKQFSNEMYELMQNYMVITLPLQNSPSYPNNLYFNLLIAVFSYVQICANISVIPY